MHHHTELPFVDEFQWVSPLHYLKNGWQNAVLRWCMLQVGPPFLHYYCVVVSHSCLILPHVGHSSNHVYTFVNLQDNWAVFRIFVALLNFFWLSLVIFFLQKNTRIPKKNWTFSKSHSVTRTFPFIQLDVYSFSLYVWPQKDQPNRLKKKSYFSKRTCATWNTIFLNFAPEPYWIIDICH